MAFIFEMCNEDNDKGILCKSKDEIKEWLSGKYIVLFYNQIRFDPKNFFEESKIKESRISYIPINSQMRQIVPYKVDQSYLSL